MLRWLVGILLFLGVLAIILHLGDLKNFALLLRRFELQLLVLALMLQLSTYLSVALAWQSILAAAGEQQPLRRLFPLSIAKLFADQAIPSAGISGNIMLMNRLSQMGVKRGHAVGAMALSVIGYYSAYLLMAALVVLMLWLRHEVTVVLATSISVFLLVASLILGGTFLLILAGDRFPRPLQQFAFVQRMSRLLAQVPRRLLRDHRLLMRVTFLSSLAFLADVATLWVVLNALGYPAAFASAFIPFIVASIAMTLGPVPMGLGSFDGVCIAMLRVLGLPIEVAATATLILRGFTLWIPLIPGLLISRRMLEVQRR